MYDLYIKPLCKGMVEVSCAPRFNYIGCPWKGSRKSDRMGCPRRLRLTEFPMQMPQRMDRGNNTANVSERNTDLEVTILCNFGYDDALSCYFGYEQRRHRRAEYQL